MTNHTTRRIDPPAGWRSLTVQIITFLFLPLALIVLAVTLGSTRLHQNAMRDLVAERDERIVRMAAQSIEDQVTARENDLRGLASQIDTYFDSRDRETYSLQPILDRSAYLDVQFDIGIVVMDRQLNIVAGRGMLTSVLQTEKHLLIEAMQMLQSDAQKDTGRIFTVSLVDAGRSANVLFLPNSDQQYVISGAYFVDPLAAKSLREAFSPDRSPSALLIAQEGKILYQQGFLYSNEGVIQHPGVQEALAGKTGRTYTDAQNGEHVVVYTMIGRFRWGLLIEEPWEEVASPQLEITHLAPLAMIPVILLAMFALLFAFRHIVRPLRLLAKQASSLGWGDYIEIEQPVGGIEEIRSLQLELIHMAHKVRTAQRSLHSYIGAITTGQEEERRRLARELHDDTIQSLISLKQKIQLVEMDYSDPPVAEALGKLSAFTERTIEDVRRMVRDLRPIYLEDLGLVAALQMLVNETNEASGIPITFENHGKERRLDPSVELALYRIVQEALSNITRHSGATRASVALRYDVAEIEVVILDNGKGFRVPSSPAEFAPGGHYGLLGMFERATLTGGTLQVRSAPDEGAQIIINVKTSETPV